jgi:hypothetical protein
MKREEILNKAESLVNGPRAKAYGDATKTTSALPRCGLCFWTKRFLSRKSTNVWWRSNSTACNPRT